MRSPQFSNVLSHVASLARAQMLKLQETIGSALAEQESMETIESSFPLCCWHCGSAHVVRTGTWKHLQRVLCKTAAAALTRPLTRRYHAFVIKKSLCATRTA